MQNKAAYAALHLTVRIVSDRKDLCFSILHLTVYAGYVPQPTRKGADFILRRIEYNAYYRYASLPVRHAHPADYVPGIFMKYFIYFVCGTHVLDNYPY